MATNWGAASYLLKKDARDEEKEIEKAGKKKGLWGSIGSTLGGLGAMAFTGGVLNPITLGLITGGASAVGGLAGSGLALNKDEKKLLTKEGGKFHKSDRKEMSETITGDILTGAATSALTAGMAQGMSNINKGMTVMGKAPKAPTQTINVGKTAALPQGLQTPQMNLTPVPVPEIKPINMTNNNIFDSITDYSGESIDDGFGSSIGGT